MKLQCNIQIHNPAFHPVIFGCRIIGGKNYILKNDKIDTETIVTFNLHEEKTDEVQLYMMNKLDAHTTLDDSGNIITDVYTRFADILIDGISYFDVIDKFSLGFNYKTQKFYQGFGNLHFNGYCKLKLRKPFCYFDFLVGNYNLNTGTQHLQKFTNL